MSPGLSAAVCAVVLLLALVVGVNAGRAATALQAAVGGGFAVLVAVGAVWVWRACRDDVAPLAHIRKDNR